MLSSVSLEIREDSLCLEKQEEKRGMLPWFLSAACFYDPCLSHWCIPGRGDSKGDSSSSGGGKFPAGQIYLVLTCF